MAPMTWHPPPTTHCSLVINVVLLCARSAPDYGVSQLCQCHSGANPSEQSIITALSDGLKMTDKDYLDIARRERTLTFDFKRHFDEPAQVGGRIGRRRRKKICVAPWHVGSPPVELVPGMADGWRRGMGRWVEDRKKESAPRPALG